MSAGKAVSKPAKAAKVVHGTASTLRKEIASAAASGGGEMSNKQKKKLARQQQQQMQQPPTPAAAAAAIMTGSTPAEAVSAPAAAAALVAAALANSKPTLTPTPTPAAVTVSAAANSAKPAPAAPAAALKPKSKSGNLSFASSAPAAAPTASAASGASASGSTASVAIGGGSGDAKSKMPPPAPVQKPTAASAGAGAKVVLASPYTVPWRVLSVPDSHSVLASIERELTAIADWLQSHKTESRRARSAKRTKRKRDKSADAASKPGATSAQPTAATPAPAAATAPAAPAVYSKLDTAVAADANRQAKGGVLLGLNEVTRALETDDCSLVIVSGGIRPATLIAHLPILSYTTRTPLIALAAAIPSTTLAAAVHGQFSSQSQSSAAVSVAAASASAALMTDDPRVDTKSDALTVGGGDSKAPKRRVATSVSRVHLPTLIAIGFRRTHSYASLLSSLIPRYSYVPDMPWIPLPKRRVEPAAAATASVAAAASPAADASRRDYIPARTELVGGSRPPHPLRGRAITRAAKRLEAKKAGKTGAAAPKSGAYHEESVHRPNKRQK